MRLRAHRGRCGARDVPAHDAVPGECGRGRDCLDDVRDRRGADVVVRRACLFCTVAMLALLAPGKVWANRGVALDIGRLDIAQKLTPGGGYRLPPVGVRNPGTEVTTYRLFVTHVRGEKGKPIPAKWFRFAPRQV